VFAAAVTPRREGTNHVDLPAALRLIDYFCDCPLRGITLLGATGEFLHLEADQRTAFVSRAITHSRLPVMVNVSHSSFDGAVLLARQAMDAGAVALLLMAPYYFRYQGPEVAEFFRRFADTVRTSLPMFLYNIPFFTSWIPIEVAESLLEEDVFDGIKDSSGDRVYMDRLLALSKRTGCTVMVGNDTIFTVARSAGAHGSVSGVACALPEMVTALDLAITAANTAKVALLENRMQEFIARIDRFPTPMGVREAVAARGLTIGPLAVPVSAAMAQEAAEFREWFRPWLEEVQHEIR